MTYSGIRAPNVEIRLGNRLASIDINDLNGKGHLKTGLAFSDVFSDLLAKNV